MNPKKFRGWCLNGCGDEIRKGATKYCSLSCFHSANRGNYNSFFDLCLNACGNAVPKKGRKYCSYSCSHAHRNLSRQQAFIAQGGTYGFVGPHFLARVLRSLYGDRCANCGWSERNQTTGRVPVEVEHIDGDWQNNALTNLTLLCPSCHALTPTFRGLNRGRGRALRLGGRANPIGLTARPPINETAPVRKVSRTALLQLALLPPT